MNKHTRVAAERQKNEQKGTENTESLVWVNHKLWFKAFKEYGALCKWRSFILIIPYVKSHMQHVYIRRKLNSFD